MKHIVFNSADDLLKFVVARRAMAGRRTSFCETLHVSNNEYRLNFDGADWDEAGDRFGGRVGSGSAEGKTVDLSRFLELILLQRVPIVYYSGVSSIVLA